jgi:hypothetical protein
MCSFFVLQGLILRKALKVQKEAEDESCRIALGNLRSEVITLRNEAIEKDKILLSLVDRLKSNEAKLDAHTKAHKIKVEEKEGCWSNQTIWSWGGETWNLRDRKVKSTKERWWASCFEREMLWNILGVLQEVKDNFARVGAYSSEQKFICGNPNGVVQWISGEVEAFDEILSDRGDFYAFAGAWGATSVLEKAGCEHAKAVV